MTWEESAEFLRQSIESHDRQLGELVETVSKTEVQLAALAARLDMFVSGTQLNFDRLTQAMLGLTDHTVDHARRISPLENERNQCECRGTVFLKSR